MHAYRTDAQNRDKVRFYIILGAILLTLLLYYLLQVFKVAVPWYIECIGTPTAASFYGIFHWFFDNFLWCYRIRQFRPFSAIPDIRGTWKGELHSSYNNTNIEVVVFIRQTWEKLSIQLESDTSRSYTTMSVLNPDGDEHSGLQYVYHNIPRPFGTTPDHWGYSDLQLSPDDKTLTGSYATIGRSRNRGTITLHLVTKEILAYEEALKRPLL